jgi:glycogen debranching enzyme
MEIIETEYRRAIESLRRCIDPTGLKASGRPDGHNQVWARDSMITLLGASLIEDPGIRQALHTSIDNLARHQASSGAIPNNIDVPTGIVNFRAYADGGLWFVIGSSLVSPREDAIRRVLEWYRCQDVDQSGLVSIQESSDWQDLFCTRGKGLYVNCLYAMALRCAGDHERAGAVRDAINRYLWYDGDGETFHHISHTFSTPNQLFDSLGRPRFTPRKRILQEDRYYLAWISFRDLGERFDCLGNLLAILSGVADEERTRSILDFIETHSLDTYPLPAIYPVIGRGDPDWRDYYGELNQPYHYHNGGVWPFVGGFYVAALVKAGRFEQAKTALERLAHMNRSGDFNEWHHGETGEPMGVRDQAWSAGMYIYAYHRVFHPAGANPPDIRLPGYLPLEHP